VKVLITGGAGFIGANLVRTLADAGATKLTVLDDLSTGAMANLDGTDVDFVLGNITDADLVNRLGADVDAIAHLGALGSVALSMEDPLLTHQANSTGTFNVLEAARHNGGAHVILASSAAVYGASEVLPKHESMATAPVSPYAASKITTESYGLGWQEAFGLPVTAFRFFNVYGPFQPAEHAYAPVIPAFLARAMSGDAVTIHGDGEQTRDFVYVQTVCDIIADAIQRRACHPGPVNLASGSTTSLLDVIDQIERTLNVAVDRVHGEPRIGDLRHSSADITTLRSLFSIEPTTFTEGLSRTIEWWQQQVS